jgi:hypothetical protein
MAPVSKADAEQAPAEEEQAQPLRAAARGQESRASADAHELIPDALGNEPQRQTAPADKTQLKRFPAPRPEDAEITAAATPDAESGAFGVSLPATGEVAGGNIRAVLEAPPDAAMVNRPMVKEQAAMASRVGRQIAGLVARPVTEWGVIGPGDTIRGHMLLLDMNTGEKVRAMDGHRVNKGELYMNLRNVPEALSTGDTIARVLGA